MSHMKTTLPRLILVAIALVLVLGAIPAQAAKPNLAPAISLGSLSPREELSATISAKAKLTRIELRIDNKKVQPWVKAHAGWKYSLKFPLQKLAVGLHTAKLQVWDQKNRGSQRQWQFQKLAALALSANTLSVQPGGRVMLTGQGFTPGTAITVGMGGLNTGVGGNYGSATADRSGRFTLEVTLDTYPDGSPLHAGSITLLAHNSDGSEKAGIELQILPAPKLSLDQSSIRPGDQVRVTGDGFTPGVAISISLGGVNTGAGGNYGSTVTDNRGAFVLTVKLAQLPDGSPLFAGPMVLVAHTPDFQEKATAQLQILADPAIALSKTALKAGEKVTVSGQGFTPGASVSIALGGVNTGASGNYGSAVVDSTGRFSLDVTLARFPDGSPLKPGTVVLLAHTPDFAEKAAAQLQVQANPTLAASKTLIRVGETVTLSGDGFTPGKVVTIGLAGVNMGHGDRYGTAAVDANGRFSFQLSLARYPDGSPLPPGGITLMAFTVDGEQASVQLQVLATPTITLDKTSIQSGDRVLVSGQGFTPGVPVSISLGGVNLGASGNYGTTVVDGNGRFSLAVTLERYPNGAALLAGPIVLVAHNTSWDQMASAQLQVVTLSASPLSVQPGDPITLTGQGFRPGSTIMLSVALYGAPPTGNYGATMVDAAGRFVLTTKLTQYPGGSPLQPGPLVLVAHDSAWSQRAAIQIQVVDRSPAAAGDLRIISLTKGATSAEPTVVGLQWRDNASNETGFRIQATFTRMNGGSDTQIWNVAANATTAQVSLVAGGINPATQVCFTVTAFNGQGDSPPSNQVCAVL